MKLGKLAILIKKEAGPKKQPALHIKKKPEEEEDEEESMESILEFLKNSMKHMPKREG